MITEIRLSGLGFDPADCDNMTIHEPGLIQPHGALLVLCPEDLKVVQVSANTKRWLGSDPEAVLSRSIDEVLGAAEAARLRTVVATERLDIGPRFALSLPPRQNALPLDVTLHMRDGLLLLELEAAGRSQPGADDPYTLLRDAVARLQSSADVQGFCQTVVDEVRRLTGFDRVMVFRFAADHSGRVIAEAMGEGLVSFLDKRFPAGDVPRPARELLARNWLRLVPDVGSEPVHLVPSDNPITGRPLDMSYCLLRHSSNLCTTYLKNMGSAGQMVMPLLRDGVLWGLVGCHHTQPRMVPFAVRTACEVFAQVASLQVAAAEHRESLDQRLAFSASREHLLSQLDQTADPAAWLIESGSGLANYIASDGLAIALCEQVILVGRTPEEAQVRELLGWLGRHKPEGVFAAAGLAEVYPPAASFNELAAGLLSIGFGPQLPAWVLWFRREQVQTVTWAGDPRKPVETGPLGEFLSPRRSFERWAETVRGNGTPWLAVEVEEAARLREAVIERLHSRALAKDRLQAELAADRKEIDSFVYVASHDLKESLRGIHKYAHMLIEQTGAKLDPEERQRLDGLIRLTDRMGGLIESLLHLSRVGRLDLSISDVELGALAAEAVEIAAPRVAEAGAEVVIGSLPTVRCDRGWVREVLVNLITNALKYNDKAQKRVEIGVAPLRAAGDLPAIFVRDNGIGIAERHKDAVFAMFKPLHGPSEYGGGTGAGLAIARKIIERHGGRVWLESTLGEGSTFFFTLDTGERPA